MSREIPRRSVLALLGGAFLAACFSERPTTGPDDDEATVVEMTPELDFVPETVNIARGETVVWRNTSSFVHTVTADPSKADDPSNVALPAGADPFDSGSIPAGGEYRRTSDVAGEYRYFCIPHEAQGMVGRIVVSA